MASIASAAPSVIRTPDQRLRVFVSSTLKELAPERDVVRSAIERLAAAPVMFELGARPHPPRALYRAYLEQSDIFVGLYWEKYGWVAPDEAAADVHQGDERRARAPRRRAAGPNPQRRHGVVQVLRRCGGAGRPA